MDSSLYRLVNFIKGLDGRVNKAGTSQRGD